MQASHISGTRVTDSQEIAATLESLGSCNKDITGLIIGPDNRVFFTDSSKPYLNATQYEYLGSL